MAPLVHIALPSLTAQTRLIHGIHNTYYYYLVISLDFSQKKLLGTTLLHTSRQHTRAVLVGRMEYL